MRRAALLVLLAGCATAVVSDLTRAPTDGPRGLAWTEAERRTLHSLSLAALQPAPHDASNRYAGDPRADVFGARLFFDPRLSRNGSISCASCHQPERYFTDGRPRSRGLGETLRGAPSLIGVAYSPWFYWDGRRDSAWSQALSPMEAPQEMGSTRIRVLRFLAADPAHRSSYQGVFGEALPDLADEDRFPPDARPTGDAAARASWSAMTAADRASVNRAFTNVGKAIAAYERRLIPGPSRFDAYVRGVLGRPPGARAELSEEERAGLRLFISPAAGCVRCHNGPLFTNHGFHNIGLSTPAGRPPDYGRLPAIDEVLQHEFNCLSEFSDAREQQCVELRFIKRDGVELPGAFKVPTLRNVAETAPYMHTGQFTTLEEVLLHYGRPGFGIGHQELAPGNFDALQRRQLAAFLATLTSERPFEPSWIPPAFPGE